MGKLYDSEAWLKRQYLKERKHVDDIAAMCGVSAMTIYRKLEKYGWYKKR